MARSDKAATVAELTVKFRESGAAVLTEYRGLTVAQLTQLRRAISANATYAVVKNTLTELAAKEAGVTAFDGQLAGPTAIAFITGDAVETAKGLRDFAKTHPALVIKSGYLDGKPLSASEITRLADLESREVLLAKLAGAMNASLSKAVYLFAAPLSQTARLIEALRAQREEQGGPVVAAAAVDPSPETEPVAQADPDVEDSAVAAEPETAVDTEPAAEAETAVDTRPAADPEPAADQG